MYSRPQYFRRAALLALLNALVVFCSPLSVARAQTDLQREFERAFSEWKQSAKDATIASQKFMICDEAEADEYRNNWIHAIERGRDQFNALVEMSMQRIRSETEPDPSVLAFLSFVLEFRFEGGDYEAANELGDAIQKALPGVPVLLEKRTLCKFATNRFEEARQLMESLIQQGVSPPPSLTTIAATVDSQIAAWKHETELRAAESKANDLPRVELTIEQNGTLENVVLELFENEAPNAVANFIDLVDNGFYNDRAFFKVVNHSDAMAGCPNDDGSGDPGYTILSEFSKPDARRHFRGSLGMVNLGQSGKEGSQFYIMLTPNPNMDGKSTVFGRVLEGMLAVDRLNRTHFTDEAKLKLNPIPNAVPARIQSARVLRKRNHEYTPQKMAQ